MRRHLLFCALGALLGCRTVSGPSGTAIALFCSTDQGAKTESLTVGEEVAVFAGPEGTEDYFLEAAQFIVGSDGRSLTYGSTVYYPDPKQAVRFLAYFPYHKGTFSVPTDQSTAKALKEADLCGATASTTPVATPVALAFEHLMARLVIQTNEPTTKISFPNAVASGVLHAATAEFILADTRSEVWTTGNELIVPVQPLSRLVLTVAGVEYVFGGSVSLEAGRTTTLDLTLHPNTKTATLSGSSVTDWELVKTEDNPTQAVSNTLLLHWPSLPQGATPDQVVFTIGGTDYAVSNGITYANHTFTVPFASQTLRYPYTITKIAFYRGATLAFPTCADLLGSMIYKTGASTVGIKDFLYNSILVDDLWWATGNLIASNAVAGEYGQGGCTVGDPMDGGLYFQFGSLIGYKGGTLTSGGTGVGSNPYTGYGTEWWDGASAWSWANDAMVWPAGLVGNPTSWPQVTSGTTHNWYFSGNGVSSGTINSTDVANGVGDPCTYYLGGTWRLPTTTELASITGRTGGGWIPWATDGLTVRWATADQTFDGVSGPGAWFGAGLNAGEGVPTFATNPFFFISGYRHGTNGAFYYISSTGFWWSSSVSNATQGHHLDAHMSNGVVPQYTHSRPHAFPVRCVSE